MTMQDRKKLLDTIFLSVSVAGVIFILTELILQAFGRSICTDVGCKVVARSARYGEVSILFIGFLIFALLIALATMRRHSSKPILEKYINFTLIVSLACEGFFVGYQAFRVHTPCTFCLTVFGSLVTLGLLRLLSGEHEVIVGFAAMAGVFSLFYLILPAESTVTIPDHERLVLFYSKECKYCAQVIDELGENKISADHVLVAEYAGLLKSMGIEHVPTLFVNNDNEKIFLTGKDEIERYLSSRLSEIKAANKADRTARQAEKTSRRTESDRVDATNDLLSPRNKPLERIIPFSEEGMCKENEECK